MSGQDPFVRHAGTAGLDTFGILELAHHANPQDLVACVSHLLSNDGIPFKASLTCGYVLLRKGYGHSGVDLVKDATNELNRGKRNHCG